MVFAFIATAFAQETANAAKLQWREAADQLRPTVPKLAVLMDSAEDDVLAYMSLSQHRAKLHSTNPLERLNGEIKRRTEVVGIFPIGDAITRSSERSCWSRMTSGRSSAPCYLTGNLYRVAASGADQGWDSGQISISVTSAGGNLALEPRRIFRASS